MRAVRVLALLIIVVLVHRDSTLEMKLLANRIPFNHSEQKWLYSNIRTSLHELDQSR